MKAMALAAALRSGLARKVIGDRLRIYRPADGETPPQSLDAHLCEVVGEPVALAFQVTRARANRKPVLRLMDSSGATVAFVKVGGNPLTAELVRGEAAALRRVSQSNLRHLLVPRVRSSHSWNQLELLVLEPLPIGHRSRQPTAPMVTRAAVELATSQGVTRGRLAASPYWRRTLSRVAELPRDQHVVRLESAIRAIEETHASLELPFGAWHGDWASWNYASRGGRLVVWDFERFDTEVPLGFDLCHLLAQEALPGADADFTLSTSRSWAEVEAALGPFDVSGRAARLVFMVYLVEISLRWIGDRQPEMGDGMAALARVLGWLDDSIRVLPGSEPPTR